MQLDSLISQEVRVCHTQDTVDVFQGEGMGIKHLMHLNKTDSYVNHAIMVLVYVKGEIVPMYVTMFNHPNHNVFEEKFQFSHLVEHINSGFKQSHDLLVMLTTTEPLHAVAEGAQLHIRSGDVNVATFTRSPVQGQQPVKVPDVKGVFYLAQLFFDNCSLDDHIRQQFLTTMLDMLSFDVKERLNHRSNINQPLSGVIQLH
tara:strand:+ start:103 stop:705 length:603 start_codon:yes stop_codon:yes gene_type:complete